MRLLAERIQVTTDPQSLQDPKNENPGVVTSDSLAAESINEGGSFAANSDSRGPGAQPSASTTTNTTDTSNAYQLDPANSRSERADGIDRDNGSAAFGGPGVNFAVGSGPSTVGSTFKNQPKPKGSNLQEGGEITGDEPNASFNNDIGGKNDPGRAALNKIEADNANVAGAGGVRTGALDSNTPYDALGGDTTS